MAGLRILDIGVGTGRTTPALRSVSKAYIGTDYSPEIIRRARARFPDAHYRLMDARNLEGFLDGMFNTVWFSFNGIDCVAHEDPLLILNEISRAIRPNGFFCFSSHNREYRALERDRLLRPLRLTANPLKLACRSALYLRSVYNSRDLRRREIP